MVSDLLQSDALLFGGAMLGIAVTSVAIFRDYLPREERPGTSVVDPLPEPFEKRAA